MSRVQLRVQDTLRDQIEEQATKSGLTLSEYVIGAISERLRRDQAAASRVELAAKDRNWFFELLDDRSPLPDPWDRAAAVAADIEG
jgi:uncharacterized protein (DUF1778 family)